MHNFYKQIQRSIAYSNYIKIEVMKPAHLPTVVLFFAVVTCCTSCIHYYYAPGGNNVPLFKEKNEARIQVQYSTVGIRADGSDVIDGFEIQSAYAVGKHTALQLNYFHAGDNEPGYGSGNGNYIEAAGGYFKPLHNNNWIFETYAGIGTGSVNSIFETEHSSETARTSVAKFFIQPSFGYSRNHFDVAFSSKFSLVNFGVRSSSVTQEKNPADFNYIESFKNGRSYFWWEPGLMIRGGFKQVKAFVQATYSIHSDETLPFCNANYSIGIIVPFKIKSK